MEDNTQMIQLLQRIEAQNRKQLTIARLRCVFSLVSAVCVVLLLVVMLQMLPQMREVITQVDVLVTEFDGVMGQMGSVLSNLEESTRQLASVDLESMVNDVNTLVLTAQSSLEQTMENLDAIDFAALNKAIKDLATVIEPLAKFTNMFG